MSRACESFSLHSRSRLRDVLSKRTTRKHIQAGRFYRQLPVLRFLLPLGAACTCRRSVECSTRARLVYTVGAVVKRQFGVQPRSLIFRVPSLEVDIYFLNDGFLLLSAQQTLYLCSASFFVGMPPRSGTTSFISFFGRGRCWPMGPIESSFLVDCCHV